jgi:putative tricarboxylic transport membrane protein
MKKLDRLSGIFWLILSVAICIHSHKLGLGRFHNPGPGFLFFWGGVVLGVLSMMILVRTMKGHKEVSIESQGNIFENVKWIKIVSVLVSLVIYGLILEWLGFLLSTIFFIALLLWSIESKKWYIIVFVSLASAFLSYALFELFLQARLPKGIFGI